MKEVALIHEVSFGMREANEASLWFVAHMLNGSTELIRMPLEEAAEFLAEENIYAIDDLEGLLCIVETNGGNVRFVSLLVHRK